MAAVRHAARRLCERALLQRGPSPGRRLMSNSSIGGKGICEQEAAKEFPNIDPQDLEAARKFPNIDPEHLKAARRFHKVHLKDVDATALKIFKGLQESPVDAHKDVTLREVRATLRALAEIQE